MQKIDWLIELFQHMNWADRRVWQSIKEFPQAANDNDIKERLYHIHATQHAFYQIWNESQIDIPKLSSFNSLNDIIKWAKDYYQELSAFLDNLDQSKLDQEIKIPWAKRLEEKIGGVPHPCSLMQSMLQVVYHSSYHRGQINSALRKLGGNPSMVDFILWIWQGKPKSEIT